MGRKAVQVDNIIFRLLSSISKGNLTVERLQLSNRTTYTLRVDNTTAAYIDIENVATPTNGVLLSFIVALIDDETSAYMLRLNNWIISSVQAETGVDNWKVIPSHPDDDSHPDERLSVLYLPESHQIQKRQPWEAIPDHLWDRLAVKLWCSGYTNQEIAQRVKVHPRTITNRISELRRRYPAAAIPTQEQRKKQMIQDDIE